MSNRLMLRDAQGRYDGQQVANPDRNADIIARALQRQRPRDIARDLGVSRNVIAGVMSRAGVISERHAQRRAKKEAASAPVITVEPPPKQYPSNRQCCFPLWPHGVRPDHPDFGRFCCAPVAPPRIGQCGEEMPSSYCIAHQKMVVSKDQPSRKFRKRMPGAATAGLVS